MNFKIWLYQILGYIGKISDGIHEVVEYTGSGIFVQLFFLSSFHLCTWWSLLINNIKIFVEIFSKVPNAVYFFKRWWKRLWYINVFNLKDKHCINKWNTSKFTQNNYRANAVIYLTSRNAQAIRLKIFQGGIEVLSFRF